MSIGISFCSVFIYLKRNTPFLFNPKQSFRKNYLYFHIQSIRTAKGSFLPENDKKKARGVLFRAFQGYEIIGKVLEIIFQAVAGIGKVLEIIFQATASIGKVQEITFRVFAGMWKDAEIIFQVLTSLGKVREIIFQADVSVGEGKKNLFYVRLIKTVQNN